MAARNVVPDFEEMRNAMTNAVRHNSIGNEDYYARNAYLEVNTLRLFSEIETLKAMLKDYKFITDTVIGKGAIPCGHYANTGLYKNTCEWCKAIQMYETLVAKDYLDQHIPDRIKQAKETFKRFGSTL